ncbi:hypothetical protein, partial [Leyella stercorea]|uniref:hypothetical protein n=1 Tax=Leyella stercorea TaxID=363265 RepID=UPI003AB7902C
DFVLWFTKSKFEDQALKWDSPWGVGYPGWHIECSCIGIKHLGIIAVYIVHIWILRDKMFLLLDAKLQ